MEIEDVHVFYLFVYFLLFIGGTPVKHLGRVYNYLDVLS